MMRFAAMMDTLFGHSARPEDVAFDAVNQAFRDFPPQFSFNPRDELCICITRDELQKIVQRAIEKAK